MHVNALGMYQDVATCKLCHDLCDPCSGSGLDNCLSCRPKVFLLDNICECEEFYYLEGNSCLICDSNKN